MSSVNMSEEGSSQVDITVDNNSAEEPSNREIMEMLLQQHKQLRSFQASLPAIIDDRIQQRFSQGDVLSTTGSNRLLLNDGNIDVPEKTVSIPGNIGVQPGNAGDPGAPPRILRDIGAQLNIQGDIGAPLNITGNVDVPPFDKESLAGSAAVDKLFSRKRPHGGEHDITMSEEIIAQVEEELGQVQNEGDTISDELAKLINNAWLESCGDGNVLQGIFKKYAMPGNLNVTVPKLNKELEISNKFGKNVNYVKDKERNLFNSSCYVTKAIAILANSADHILQAVDDRVSVNHNMLVKDCLNAVTLLSHISAEFTNKRLSNMRNIVSEEYLSLCGPKPGTSAAKGKPKNPGTVHLLGDDLKSASKEAKRAVDIVSKVPRFTPSSTITRPTQQGASPQQQQSSFRFATPSPGRYKGKSRAPSNYNNKNNNNNNSGYNNNNANYNKNKQGNHQRQWKYSKR